MIPLATYSSFLASLASPHSLFDAPYIITTPLTTALSDTVRFKRYLIIVDARQDNGSLVKLEQRHSHRPEVDRLVVL